MGNRIGKPVVMCLELWFIFLIIVLYVCWIWIIKFLNIWVFKYTNIWILKKAFFNAFCVWERWHGRKIFSETTRRMQALQEVCKSRTRLLELQRCEKLSDNASIVQLSCKLYNSKVYTEFRIYRKLNICNTHSIPRGFFDTLDKAFSECYTRCVALSNDKCYCSSIGRATDL